MESSYEWFATIGIEYPTGVYVHPRLPEFVIAKISDELDRDTEDIEFTPQNRLPHQCIEFNIFLDAYSKIQATKECRRAKTAILGVLDIPKEYIKECSVYPAEPMPPDAS